MDNDNRKSRTILIMIIFIAINLILIHITQIAIDFKTHEGIIEVPSAMALWELYDQLSALDVILFSLIIPLAILGLYYSKSSNQYHIPMKRLRIGISLIIIGLFFPLVMDYLINGGYIIVDIFSKIGLLLRDIGILIIFIIVYRATTKTTSPATEDMIEESEIPEEEYNQKPMNNIDEVKNE